MPNGEDTIDLIERLGRIVTNAGHTHGLKPAQWEALRYLSRANRFSRTPGALTAYLGATKGTVSQTLMSLERAGLIAKRADPADRRSVHVDLTAAGRQRLALDETGAIRHAFSMLPAQQQQQFDTALRGLIRNRLALSGGRPFGVCRACRHFAADAHGSGLHHCRLLDERLTATDADEICQEQEVA